MEIFHFDLVLKSWRGLVNTSHNRHTYMLKNIRIHQSFTVNGSRRLTEGLQYTNTFLPEICSYIDSVGVDFDEDDDNSSHPPHKHKPRPCTA